MLSAAPVNSRKIFTFEKLFIPLSLIGLTGSALRYFNAVCTGNVRWLTLLFLFLFFVIKKNYLRHIDEKFGFFLFTYLIWSFLSLFWANVPLFSLMKCGIYIIVCLTMIRAGIEWVKLNGKTCALDYLSILAFIVLIGACLAKMFGRTTFGGFFEGYVAGPNMFGTFMGISLPFFLWRCYIASSNRKKLAWGILTAICFYFIILSCSRAALLLGLVTLSGFLINLNMNKKLFIASMFLIFVACLIIIFPGYFYNLIDAIQFHIYKGAGKNLFQTRSALWEHAYEGAQAGGWFGLGFGMLLEQFELDFSNGLKFILPAMERGNSQLIIIQEIGIVGFIMYLLILISLSLKLFLLTINSIQREQKILIGLLGGSFLGMIAHSLFEGWWTAPGGQENFLFWILVGVILGVENAIKLERQAVTRNKRSIS